jgi:thiamine-phosphate pyrophosphorylase
MTGRTSIVCCVTDRRRFGLSCAGVVERVRWAAASGVDLIQVRERDLSDRELAGLVRAIVAAASGFQARVLVNERLDVAMAAGASGVHLRADSMTASLARAAAPHGFLIGRSVHGIEEARVAADAGGCDYLLFGTVFPSAGKPEGHIVAGIGAVGAVCRSVELPVIGIGGVDAARARTLAEAGAAGAAAVELFMSASTEAIMRTRVEHVRRAFDIPFAGCLQ